MYYLWPNKEFQKDYRAAIEKAQSSNCTIFCNKVLSYSRFNFLDSKDEGIKNLIYNENEKDYHRIFD